MRWSSQIWAAGRALGIGLALALGSVGCGSELDGDESASSTESAQSTDQAKILKIQYQAQLTGYWCGPAATRIALSARINAPTQAQLVPVLRTDTDGTDSVHDIVRAMNQYLGGVEYEARPFYNGGLSRQQKDKFWNEIVTGVDNGYPTVVNIVAYPHNRPRGYPNKTTYHYIVAAGYNPQNASVYIADSARFGGMENFWISLDQLSELVAPRGYATAVPKGRTCPGGSGSVRGEIEAKFVSLGGCGSFLGAPMTGEQIAPDGTGRFTAFKNGSIYWTQKLGAYEVHGLIRQAWEKAGWEAGPLGYPISDVTPMNDRTGEYSKFENGAIYSRPKTGTHSMRGEIYRKWLEEGAERSDIGNPTSSEYDDAGLRRGEFERGSIVWDPKTRIATVRPKKTQ